MKRWVSAGIVLLLCLCLSACGMQTGQKVTDNIRIGILLYKQDDTFIQKELSCIEESVKKIEQEKNVKVTVSVMDAGGNQSTQNDQMDRLIDQGVDVLCINIVDRTVAATEINKAKAAGVPLVFFNREPVREDLSLWDKVYYVGANASESGTLQGQIVIDNCRKDFAKVDKNGDGKIQYVMIEGEQGHQDTLLRTEYSVQSIVNYGYPVEKLDSDTANWQRSQAVTKMNNWIEKYGDTIEVVLCNNDEMALGAVEAYTQQGQESCPVIVGVDGIDEALMAVKKGTMAGTVYNDAAGQADKVAQLCYNLATNQGYYSSSQRFVYLPYTKITHDSVGEFIK